MNYPSIRIEGAILSPDILDRLDELPGQKPVDFGLDSGGKVKDEIARVWADAQDSFMHRNAQQLAPAEAAPAASDLVAHRIGGLLRPATLRPAL